MDQGHRKANVTKGVPVRCSGVCTGVALPCLMGKQLEAAGVRRVLRSQTKQQDVGVGSTEADRHKHQAPTRLP